MTTLQPCPPLHLAPGLPAHAGLIAISTSARTLVQAARRAGLAVCAVDAFGDVDTIAQAARWQRAALAPAGGLDACAVLQALAGHGPTSACVVLGSGLEDSPEAIEQLATRHTLLGNHPSVWRVAHDPRLWFALTLSLGLPTPAVRHDAPADPADWLRKRAGSSGGQHVQAVTSCLDAVALASGSWYYQRRIAGPVYSLLFLANGREVCTVGFNRMLPAPPEAATPWVWAGAVRPAGLPTALCARVEAAAQALTAALGLRGLNGLDFIVQGEAWLLLELNPRPTATLDLWDAEPMPPLFSLHLRACAGDLPQQPLPQPPGARAMAVAYAGQPLQVPCDLAWPAACRDRPRAGLRLQPGDPLCTLHAIHATVDGATAKVHKLRQQLLRKLGCGLLPASTMTAPRTVSAPFVTPNTVRLGAGWCHGLQAKVRELMR